MAAVPTSDGARARARWVLVTQLAAWTVFAVGLAGPLTATAGDPPASTLALFVGIPIALLLASARRAGRWLLVGVSLELLAVILVVVFLYLAVWPPIEPLVDSEHGGFRRPAWQLRRPAAT